MHDWLHDLYRHQAWADAEHWRAFEGHPPALEDRAIRERLHHIHLVQRAFLSAARGEPIVGTRPSEFESMAALKEYGVQYHREVGPFVEGLSDARLGELMQIPWFKDPPLRITVAEGLTQAAMHSHYHRGQNATRLRELGGAPPLTDFIVWLWKGRPAAEWTAGSSGSGTEIGDAESRVNDPGLPGGRGQPGGAYE
jgi:uncharacterized damage-inducible protein DinB